MDVFASPPVELRALLLPSLCDCRNGDEDEYEDEHDRSCRKVERPGVLDMPLFLCIPLPLPSLALALHNIPTS